MGRKSRASSEGDRRSSERFNSSDQWAGNQGPVAKATEGRLSGSSSSNQRFNSSDQRASRCLFARELKTAEESKIW